MNVKTGPATVANKAKGLLQLSQIPQLLKSRKPQHPHIILPTVVCTIS